MRRKERKYESDNGKKKWRNGSVGIWATKYCSCVKGTKEHVEIRIFVLT